MTSTWLWATRPAWRTVVGSVVKRRERPRVRVVYAGLDPISPTQFWDLVARQLRLMRTPYLNLAVKGDAPHTPYFQQVAAVLEALADHPLAHRIELIDPLDAMPHLLPGWTDPSTKPDVEPSVEV